jgi:predicted nucleotidyltransferase
MRLSKKEIETIKGSASEWFGEGTRVILFGSRVFDEKRGGDIDLLIVPVLPDNDLYEKKLRFITAVKQGIGEQKLDIIVSEPNDRREIVKQAVKTGVEL